MRFVKVNYHLNKKFFVEDLAYKEMIHKTLQGIEEHIKVVALEVTCFEKNNSFAVFLTLVKNSKSKYAPLAHQIQREIEEKSQLLINAKPVNIEIRFKEK